MKTQDLTQVLRKSRLYETAPELVTDQPRFLNAALAVQTKLLPHELLRSLKKVEVTVLPDRVSASLHESAVQVVPQQGGGA